MDRSTESACILDVMEAVRQLFRAKLPPALWNEALGFCELLLTDERKQLLSEALSSERPLTLDDLLAL